MDQEFVFEFGDGVVAVVLVFGDEVLAGGVFVGEGVDEPHNTGLALLKESVEQPAGSGLAVDLEAGGIAQVVQEVPGGPGFCGQAPDIGGLKGGRVDDVAVQVEEGGVVEGGGDFAEFDVGPDPFLAFVEGPVGELVGIFAQDLAVEGEEVAAVLGRTRLPLEARVGLEQHRVQTALGYPD